MTSLFYKYKDIFSKKIYIIKIYDSSGSEDINTSIIDNKYNIVSITDMITGESIESIDLDNFFKCDKSFYIKTDNITPVFFPVNPDGTGGIQYYERIDKYCNFQFKVGYPLWDVDSNNKYTMDFTNMKNRIRNDITFHPTYESCFFDNFLDNREYLLFPNGYTGFVKEYHCSSSSSDWYYKEVYINRTVFIVNGKFNGIETIYYSDGNINKELEYADGLLLSYKKYKYNKLIKTKYYDQYGRKIYK